MRQRIRPSFHTLHGSARTSKDLFIPRSQNTQDWKEHSWCM